MAYTYNRKGITRKVLSEIVRGLGAKDELKILKSCAYLVRYALRARGTGDKGVTVFHNLDADAISEVYISDSALRHRKIVATRKCSWHVCASCHYDVSSFPTYLQSNRTPCPRKSLGWGVVAGSCWIVLKTAVKRDAVFMRRDLPQDICFQLTSRLRVVLPATFNIT